jgi:hypothetical protein
MRPGKTFSRNQPEKYVWTEALLTRITQCGADKVAVGPSGPATPLFLVVGSCPSTLVPMQVMMFALDSSSTVSEPRIEFWWIKPQPKNPRALEPGYLKYQVSGSQKNAAGMSKPFFQGIADLFGKIHSGCRWQVQDVDGAPRCVIEDAEGLRMYVYMCWLEDWASPASRQKFVRGKLCFELSACSGVFYDRTFEIVDGRFLLAQLFGEACGPSPLPGQAVKLGCSKDDLV